MKEYYVYEMHEVLSPTGKPYIGNSCNFYGRAIKHKCDYKLEKRPELIPIAGPYYSKKEAWHVEQPYRVANGWPDERETATKTGKRNVENGKGWFGMTKEAKSERSIRGGSKTGKKHAENGTGIFGMSEEDKYKRNSNGKGRIWITDGTTNKRIYPNEFEKYQQLGFYLGKVMRK
jgi:hypothetical protein